MHFITFFGMFVSHLLHMLVLLMIAEDMLPGFLLSMPADLLQNQRTDGTLWITCTTATPWHHFSASQAIWQTCCSHSYPVSWLLYHYPQSSRYLHASQSLQWLRLDGRYGLDDHMQWPHPFLPALYSQKNAAEHLIMWWNTTIQVGELGFYHIGTNGTVLQAVEWMDVWATNDHNIHHPAIESLSVNLCCTWRLGGGCECILMYGQVTGVLENQLPMITSSWLIAHTCCLNHNHGKMPWALSIVAPKTEELSSSTKLAENNRRYVFPEPGLFCSGNNNRWWN